MLQRFRRATPTSKWRSPSCFVAVRVALHYAIVCKFWTPDAQAYAGLAELYVTHPDFKARYDAHDESLAEFLRDAMVVYATRNLAVAES